MLHQETSGGGGSQLAGLLDPALLDMLTRRPGKPIPTATPNLGGSAYDPNEGLRQSAEASKLRAMISPPPLDPLIMIGNTGMAYQHDPNKMNAFQRQAYLPQNSQMAGNINQTRGGSFGDDDQGGQQRGARGQADALDQWYNMPEWERTKRMERAGYGAGDLSKEKYSWER